MSPDGASGSGDGGLTSSSDALVSDAGDASGRDTGGAGDTGGAAPLASRDPAPSLDSPGKYTLPAQCPGCPTTADTVFEVQAGAATNRRFEGTVTRAIGDGEFFVEALEVPDGGRRELWGPIRTDPMTGQFSFTAPLFCGAQLVKCVWSNAEGRYVLVTRVVTTDCIEPDIRVTLSWDHLGNDWELHLVKPGGRINDASTDCTWNTCIGAGLDWGVTGDARDNPRKDVDNTGQFGPENIFLARPEAGRYAVLVEHWGNGMPQADGQVIINVRGQVFGFQMEDLPPLWVWNVATIDWPVGIVTGVGTRHDCSSNWSGGCRLPLP